MGRTGKHGALRLHQVLDAVGGTFEAASELGDLVLPFHLYSGTQLAGPQRLDPGLEPFQPAGQAARHRQGTHAYGKSEQSQSQQAVQRPVQGRGSVTGDDPATIRKGDGDREPGSSRIHDASFQPRDGTFGWRLGMGGQECAASVVDGEFDREQTAVAHDCCLQPGQGLIRRRQQVAEDDSNPFRQLDVALRFGSVQKLGRAAEQREEEDDAERRQIELQVQASHQSSSWSRAKT